MISEEQNVRVRFQEKALKFDVWASCLNCHNWAPNAIGASPKAPEMCTRYNVKPPLNVIVLSCEAWLPVIPF